MLLVSDKRRLDRLEQHLDERDQPNQRPEGLIP
jgi:hypothetical protein